MAQTNKDAAVVKMKELVAALSSLERIRVSTVMGTLYMSRSLLVHYYCTFSLIFVVSQFEEIHTIFAFLNIRYVILLALPVALPGQLHTNITFLKI